MAKLEPKTVQKLLQLNLENVCLFPFFSEVVGAKPDPWGP